VKRELDSLRDLLVDPVALAAVKIDFQVWSRMNYNHFGNT
jgi:hypothetical protein